jgi:SAM-dependent methyltransferase
MNQEQLATPDGSGLFPFLPMSESANINRWIFDTVLPFMKGRILEIGSGTGTFSSFFIENATALHLCEQDQTDRRMLREKYKQNEIVRTIQNIDFHHPNFQESYSYNIGAFDTIFKLNSASRIPIDPETIGNAKQLLHESGYIILLAPAYTTSYNGLTDEDLRKYNWISIKHLLGNDLEIVNTWYINMPTTIDPFVLTQTGLSVVIVATKISIAKD